MKQENRIPWIEKKIIFPTLKKKTRPEPILPPNSELKEALDDLLHDFGIRFKGLNSYKNVLYTNDMVQLYTTKDDPHTNSDRSKSFQTRSYKRVNEILEEESIQGIREERVEQEDEHPHDDKENEFRIFDIFSQSTLDDDEVQEEKVNEEKQSESSDPEMLQGSDDKEEFEAEPEEKPANPDFSDPMFSQNTALEHPPQDEERQINPGGMASVTPSLKCGHPYELSNELLEEGDEVYNYGDLEETKRIIKILEETLQQFNIEGRVVGIQRGPIITRFEVKMAPGIKVNRILSLTDELAMALEAFRVRVEAPIPGRSTVGIEIPNRRRITVLLGDILRTENYRDFEARLPLPIGKDIAGNLVIADLTKLPHLLIAGATGAGKSVSVNSFIVNFILNKSPENIRFLMIDPKLVELSQYNNIPHLLHPVITDPQKAVAALNWAVEEMERRYEDLADTRVRDISSYNKKITETGSSNEVVPMPYIVVLVDELGDLMMVAGKEVESSIIRLSQKARAVGIHLILATQRPSVDVITALIKANCPARIALQVAQKTDSRTILDANGAEQLLGQGDSLFKHPTQGQLVRIQAPLVSDHEVERVVKEVKKYAEPNYIILEDSKGSASKLDATDEVLFEEAWEVILESQKASASYLQRRLRIGYNKAARLIEAFEARGYIGPQIGSKPRDIFAPGGT